MGYQDRSSPFVLKRPSITFIQYLIGFKFTIKHFYADSTFIKAMFDSKKIPDIVWYFFSG